MAGIAVPGIPQQIRLIGRLRWMLFKNSLRTIKGRLEAVSTGILWLMMAGLVFGGGIFFGIATYWLIHNSLWSWLALLLWIVFIFWQIYPIFAASVGAQFDFSNLLRFPLRFGSFFALSIIYGLFDPGAVASVVWLFAMWIGLTLARPALFLWGFIVLLAFAALNLFFARMLFVWIERWLAQRRTREILGLIFILFFISFQFIGPAIEHFQDRHSHLQSVWILALLPLANALPAGVAAHSLRSALAGLFIPAAYSLLFVLIYAAVFLWFFRLRLAAQYRGENLSETAAVAPAPAARQRAPSLRISKTTASSWEIPGLSRPVAAIFEKEIRYALRSGIMLLNLFVPLLVIIILAVTPHQTHSGDDFFRHASKMIFPIAIAYAILIQTNWVFNCFAFEGTGIQFLFMAPVRFREIMVGKNLFLGVISFVEALLIWAIVSIVFSPPPPMIVAAGFAGLLYATIANCAIGNILSLCYPRRLEFGVFRQKKQAGVTVFFGLIAQVVLIGLGAGVFMLAQFLHRPALAVFIFIGFAMLTAIAYRVSLNRVDSIALNHRETLTAELCRQE